MCNMDLFSNIFFIVTSGIFLSIFMLLIEHPKRWYIGALIYALLIILTFSSINLVPLIPLFCPLLILLDVKHLTWNICLKYLGAFVCILGAWIVIIVPYLPFYFYPILIFLYVLIAHQAVNKNFLGRGDKHKIL